MRDGGYAQPSRSLSLTWSHLEKQAPLVCALSSVDRASTAHSPPFTALVVLLLELLKVGLILPHLSEQLLQLLLEVCLQRGQE